MAKIKDWLMKQRLDNYGYDRSWFVKMQRHKARVKQKLKGRSDREVRKSLAKAGILGRGGRLQTKRGKVRYTTGQSFNEELLNMLTLGATKGKKSFWKVQENW